MILEENLIVPPTAEDLTAGFRTASILLALVRKDIAWQERFGGITRPGSLIDERDLLAYMAKSPAYTPKSYGL